MGYLAKKVRVNVNLDGVDCFFFYSFACGDYLRTHYGTPQKADKAFYSAIFKTDESGEYVQGPNGGLVQKTEDELFADGILIETMREYVYALTITWAKETNTKPIDIMDISIDSFSDIIVSVATAIGIAMPKPDENAKKDPQTP